MRAILDLWMRIVTVLGGLLIFITVWVLDTFDKCGIAHELNGYAMNLAYGIGLILLGTIYFEIRRK